jgi:hypothetical protein
LRNELSLVIAAQQFADQPLPFGGRDFVSDLSQARLANTFNRITDQKMDLQSAPLQYMAQAKIREGILSCLANFGQCCG